MPIKSLKKLKDERVEALKKWAKLIEDVTKDYAKLTRTEKAVVIDNAKQLTAAVINLTADITAEIQHNQFRQAIEYNASNNLLTKIKESGIIKP